MSDSRDCKDAESVRSQAVLWECRAATMGRQMFGIRHGRSGNVFANPRASSSSPFRGELNPWISHVTEDTLVRTSTGGPVACDELQIPDTATNPKPQTGPSARNSFDPKGGKILKELCCRPTKTADLGTSL